MCVCARILCCWGEIGASDPQILENSCLARWDLTRLLEIHVRLCENPSWKRAKFSRGRAEFICECAKSMRGFARILPGRAQNGRASVRDSRTFAREYCGSWSEFLSPIPSFSKIPGGCDGILRECANFTRERACFMCERARITCGSSRNWRASVRNSRASVRDSSAIVREPCAGGAQNWRAFVRESFVVGSELAFSIPIFSKIPAGCAGILRECARILRGSAQNWRAGVRNSRANARDSCVGARKFGARACGIHAIHLRLRENPARKREKLVRECAEFKRVGERLLF